MGSYTTEHSLAIEKIGSPIVPPPLPSFSLAVGHGEEREERHQKMPGGFLGLRVVTEMDCGSVGAILGVIGLL